MEQLKETPVKPQLNNKDSQKEFEYANDSFENPDLPKEEIQKKKSRLIEEHPKIITNG